MKKAVQVSSIRQLLLGTTNADSAASVVTSATPKETKKKVKVAKDSKGPKKPLGAYNIWLRGARSKIVASLPVEDRKNSALVNKVAGTRWRGLSERSKKRYHERSEAAAEEYKTALAKYKAKET
mmetsp:Transcript_61460/g.165838  ORF Transcript_61460/g.165838 Transcript_61460/m.165838 type:complete len:124 (-) Transcript_61460:233-604(-)